MKSCHHRIATAVAIAALAALSARAVVATPRALTGSLQRPQVIAWGTCPESWVGSTSDSLGDRLQCGSMTVPLDHVAPDGRMMEVGVVRVRAGTRAQREGAIFFNNGGPGSHPGKLLQATAAAWARADPNDPDEVDKRRLSERYDFVAVIPRGLVGSSEFSCGPSVPRGFPFLPTHLDDDTWNLAVADARAVVQGCRAFESARYINTEQFVHDMDALRRSLGDDRLHFYGISYGGMVGAWYAATYPEHAGRMLLDSTLDFTRDYRMATRASMLALHGEFTRKAIAPLLANARRYGLGTSNDAASAIDDLPPRIREVWVREMTSPVRLAAALHVASWMRRDNPATFDALAYILQRSPTSADHSLDRSIRWEASRLASVLYAPPRIPHGFFTATDQDAVRTLVPCNDWAWTRGEEAIRDTLRQDAARYFSVTGEETLDELVCLHWGAPSSRAPDLAHLGNVTPFLLIQSEKDTSTPIGGARRIVDRFATANMLLVRGSSLHGVFNYTTSPCVERTAARYLLTGIVPASASRIAACEGRFDNPLDALPGAAPTPASVPVPVPVDVPLPAGHDEL
jgi:pimeloyl-ACP methyl ester carboxylesterase